MIVYSFTTRDQGDMKDSERNRKKAMRDLFGRERELITVRQKHTNKVGVDAVVSTRKDTAVGVYVADCVPILLAGRGVVAAVHAGWRGTLGGIVANTIGEMKKHGSKPQEISAWIGPRIGMCHYDVPEERAKKFLHVFGNDPKVVSFFDDRWSLDLGFANYRQLIEAGVKPERIKAKPSCTYCQNDTYFSFRKEKNLPGEMMAIIGFA